MRKILALTLMSLTLATQARAQGSLTPPGSPTPSMKTLDQVSPGTCLGGSYTSVTLDKPGYYYLTTNLQFSGAWGISISTNNVTLDLRGFTVSGDGSGGGAIGAYANTTNVTVRNGRISGTKGGALLMQSSYHCRVEDIAADHNAQGIWVGPGSQVSRTTSRDNGSPGIQVGDNSLVEDCVVQGCNSMAILVGRNGIVRHCTSVGNTGYGISSDAGGLISHCVANGNTQYGIRLTGTGTVEDCQAMGNTNNGIYLALGGSARNCTANGNGVYGFQAETGVRLVNCSACGNTNSGVYVLEGATLLQCESSGNGGNGFYTGRNATVQDCVARGNNNHGLVTSDGCQVLGSVSQTNKFQGIFTSKGSHLRHCIVTGNGSVGLNTSDNCELRDNSVVGNLGDGIEVTSQCTVLNNTSSSNGVKGGSARQGIYAGGHRNHIEGNRLRSNSGYGLYMTGTNNVVLRNSAGDNGSGVYTATSSPNDSAPWTTAAAMTSPAGNTTSP